MSTVYTKTDNYGLNLYGDNDPADLRDGYNGSMNVVDTTLKQHLDRIANNENVSKALLGENASQKAAEAKAKWDQAATDAGYAKAKADDNASKITTLSDKTEVLTTRSNLEYNSILAIGDSITFGTGTSNHVSDNWVSNLAKFTKTDTGSVTNLAENGAGFISAGGGDHKYNFRQQLEYASSLRITPECIIIAGGINDAWSNSAADIKSAVHNALTYASQNWPNASIWYMPAPIARCIGYAGAASKNLAVLPALIEGANGIARVKTIRYAWEWLNPMDNVAYDDVHPNDLGSRTLAEFAYRSMQGETIRANRAPERVTTKNPEKYNANELYVSVNNGFCQIYGRIGIIKEVQAFDQIFQLPVGFNYSGILNGIRSDAPSMDNIYYPGTTGREVMTHQTLPPRTTIYSNTLWQIGVS